MTGAAQARRLGVPVWRRAFSALSLVLLSILALGYLWWGKFDYHHSFWSWTAYTGAGLLLAANHFVHRDDRKRLGLRWDNWGPAGRMFGGFTLAAGAAILVAGAIWGELTPIGWAAAATYTVWAFVQQHLLQNFLRLRGTEVFSTLRRPALAASLLAAVLFALYHLPNGLLMAFSFFGAAVWCPLFSRRPNLFWAGFSQTALTLLLVVFFKFSLLDQFAVGRPGYRYDFYGGGVKVAGGADARGRPFVATLPGPDRDVSALVRIFDPSGTRLHEWVAFEELGFSGELAVGDLGFGPGDEIAVSPGPGAGNPPLVKIFDAAGSTLAAFRAPELDPGYGLWISVACKRLYVCPGPAPGAPARVLELDPAGRLLRRWDFPELGLVNGVRATAVCSPTGRPETLLLWGTDISVNPSTVFILEPSGRRPARPLETLKTTFGVQIAVATRLGETVVASAPGPLRGYPPLVRVIDLAGAQLQQFAGEIPGALGCGANLGSFDADGDGEPEWLLGEGTCPGQPRLVHLHAFDGRPIRSWRAY